MILLWGLSGDSPLEAVRDVLERRASPVFFLDQRQVLTTAIEWVVGGDDGDAIHTPDGTCDLSEVSAVYVRTYDTRLLPEIEAAGAGSAAWRHALEVDETLAVWLELTPARVVNPLSAMGSNASKPYQLGLIRSSGFAVPDTLITTDPQAARAFWGHHGAVVYKSISGVRSIVSRLSREHLGRLEDIAWCPTQFQEYIPGHDCRVHVVGEDVFACEVISQADDYRYGARQGMAVEIRPCEIPIDCAARCRALSASLGLAVAGIDLRRTPDGRWYCFEVNPSPGFTYYQAVTRQPIAEAIARLLLAGAPIKPTPS
jgi:glutathione synthase/RimK-type ligase-like ATP-grasp enzyme